MKKKHREYLIIPMANIRSKDNQAITINSNLTSKYQKIILKLSLGDKAHSGDAYEVLSKQPFYFNGSLIQFLLKGKPYDTIDLESDNLLVDIHPKFVSIDEVKIFLNDVINSDEASNYKEFISDLLLNKKFTRTKKH